MDETPLFSIITVCRNAEKEIGHTLDSIINQRFRDFEFIVIDGASTDSTLKAIEDSGAVPSLLISEPDNGIYDAMNKGLAHAKGEYVIFLNAGDSFHSADTLERIAAAISLCVKENDEKPGVVYGDTVIVGHDREELAPRHLSAPAELTLKSFADGMVVCHQAFIALRKITSRFDVKYRFSADYDWCIRCLQHSRLNVKVDGVIIDFLHEGATSENRRKSLIERFKIMAFYYGTFVAIRRHIGFIPRRLRRKRVERHFPKNQQN